MRAGDGGGLHSIDESSTDCIDPTYCLDINKNSSFYSSSDSNLIRIFTSNINPYRVVHNSMSITKLSPVFISRSRWCLFKSHNV
jgi:hypothetical protein